MTDIKNGDKVKICSYVKRSTAIYLYSQSKIRKSTMGKIIDEMVEKCH